MKISHECPLDLLDLSLTFNDYQYLLPHYWEKYPKYKEFFINYRNKKDSFIIMDNGLFEGGVLPQEKLVEIIQEIKPNIFILPDAWNDSKVTLGYAEKWINETILPSNVKPMIVLQGKSIFELDQMVSDSWKLGIRHFSFNHSSEAYNKVFPHENELISKMMGRIITFRELMDRDLFDDLKRSYIHFLGVNLPQEVYLLGNLKKYITSIDTSNPILVGAVGNRYETLGIDFKPKEKIEKFMEEDLASKIENIIFNVGLFKKWSI